MYYPVEDTCQIYNLAELYEKYFGQKNDGTFVEVGAYDGRNWSNTAGLADIGWRGLYFEPMHELAVRCQKNHDKNRVETFCIAVGDFCGSTKLFTSSNPTIDAETVEANPWESPYDPEQFIITPVITLNRALDIVHWPQQFDLLCIDVEGAELKVLNGIDLNLWQPRMIIIETHEGSGDKRRTFHTQGVLDYMSGQPYDKVQTDGLNTVYWRK